VGGRYSALTAFGLVPAALIGCDIASLLKSAQALRKNVVQVCLPEEIQVWF
jgi:glucose-6-phosphate isomerase